MIIRAMHFDFFRGYKEISKTGKRDVIVNGLRFQSDGWNCLLGSFLIVNLPGHNVVRA